LPLAGERQQDIDLLVGERPSCDRRAVVPHLGAVVQHVGAVGAELRLQFADAVSHPAGRVADPQTGLLGAADRRHHLAGGQLRRADERTVDVADHVADRGGLPLVEPAPGGQPGGQ